MTKKQPAKAAKKPLTKAASKIKHPGIEKAKAKRNGVSTHEQLEKDSHSSNAKVRARGNLGLALTEANKHKAGMPTRKSAKKDANRKTRNKGRA